MSRRNRIDFARFSRRFVRKRPILYVFCETFVRVFSVYRVAAACRRQGCNRMAREVHAHVRTYEPQWQSRSQQWPPKTLIFFLLLLSNPPIRKGEHAQRLHDAWLQQQGSSLPVSSRSRCKRKERLRSENVPSCIAETNPTSAHRPTQGRPHPHNPLSTLLVKKMQPPRV